jgi:hypothetical protein
VNNELKALKERDLQFQFDSKKSKKAQFNCYASFISILKVFFFFPKAPLQEFEDDDEDIEIEPLVGGIGVIGDINPSNKIGEEMKKEKNSDGLAQSEKGKKINESEEGVNRAMTMRGKKVYEHEESPDWEDVAKMMVDVIPKAEKEYEEKKFKKENAIWRWNSTNTLAVISKVKQNLTKLSMKKCLNVINDKKY